MFKLIVASALAIFASAGFAEDLCPQSRAVTCEADAQKAYSVCAEAAKEKGQDQEADLNCVKYFTEMRH